MATLLEKFDALNQADLAGLKERIADLRAQAEAELKKSKLDPAGDASKETISKVAQSAGLTVEEFMATLERAKKTGLI